MSLILDGTNGLSDVDGSASTPAIRGTDTNTGIFFPAADTIAFAEGGAEVARFDSSGNLGIGTSSPAAKLHVVSAPSSVQLRWSDGTNGTAYSDTVSGATRLWSNVSLAIGTGSDSFAERMRIDSSGNLLVGTTNSGVGVDGIALQVSTNPGNPIVFLNSSAGTAGYISVNGTSTAYITSSDYRLKENIAPMTGALAKVQSLKPCTYTWKSTGDADEGFIAHELAEFCPNAVSGEKDAVNEDGSIKPQGIDTSFLVATLTAAIQEQQAIITDLKSRIETLEAK
jgi:hypothetical protein